MLNSYIELLLLGGCFILYHVAKTKKTQKPFCQEDVHIPSTDSKAWKRHSQRSRMYSELCTTFGVFRWEREREHQAAILRVREKLKLRNTGSEQIQKTDLEVRALNQTVDTSTHARPQRVTTLGTPTGGLWIWEKSLFSADLFRQRLVLDPS